MRQRRLVRIEGIVQGVGFRPYVYKLARRHGLSGSVSNDEQGVAIEIEGEAAALDRFLGGLKEEQPPLVRIDSLDYDLVPARNEATFTILESLTSPDRRALITPDAAVCDDCLRELFDPTDRRYRYPLINCTNCGPRFTIVQDIPYDRAQTTMAAFEMCVECRREYENPADRRFHAQPNACPECGPAVSLLRPDGIETEGDAIEEAATLLKQGRILAVKGLGGYFLACDATNDRAVATLRQRKQRDEKPFAVMAADLEMAHRTCLLDDAEQTMLLSPARPITLLQRRPSDISGAVAPGQLRLGIMLPYTPLHHLLLRECGAAIVMTSGNRSEEPIAYRDQDALERLAGIADAFLVHDRPIETRCDDSVSRSEQGVERIIRRARGLAPAPIKLATPLSHPTLACGGHLKNTFCLAQGDRAFVSHHIGDLENYETLRAFEEGIEHYQRLFGISPVLIAHDLHPEYLSTRYALSLPGVKTVAVQHHHAHVAACMAEHGLSGAVLSVAFDGSGYGPDGTVWGGELLKADYTGYQRLAHIEQVPLPGGEAAVRQPWRVAAAWLHQVYGDGMKDLDIEFSRRLQTMPWPTLRGMIERKVNSPLTSSAGRLFDAVASLLGIRHQVSYEGQAAIELEAAADEAEQGAYFLPLSDGEPAVFQAGVMIRDIVGDVSRGIAPSLISARFHNALAGAVCRACCRMRDEHGLNRVVLSGGCFQNMWLLTQTSRQLEAMGFEVYAPSRIPANDGGLSLGQAVIAGATGALEDAKDRGALCV